MKNLELLELVHKRAPDTFSEVTFFAQTSDSIYFIFNNLLHKYDFINNLTTELCPKPFEDVICIKILIIEDKICVVTPQNLNIIDLDGITQSITFEEKIETISWNPTEDLVVTVARNGAVSSFSVDYENGEIYPQGGSSVNAQIPDTVYVGWGSKDTQFRGSEGRLKNQKPVAVEPISDQRISISWRGNGEMFVVNYWENHKRKFMVFETPCKAMFRSEDSPGLQSTVAWRPAGNMIATLSTISNKQSVVIFEKNGQKRFAFDLNLDHVIVKHLKWSPCAQILTLYSESSNSQNIHLFTSTNYQWYEKQTLTFSETNPILNFEWLETTQFTFTLRVITKRAILNYTFRHLVNNSQATCAVINGQILQLTDFADSIIPPPMYLNKFANDRSINCVVFNDNRIAVVDSSNCIKIFEVDKPETVLSTLRLGEILDNLLEFPLACHHFFFKGDEICFAAETDSETVLYSLNPENNELNFIDAFNEPLRQFPNDNSLDNSIKQSIKLINDKSFNFQLTSSCHFYLNCQKICDSVNSFLIFNDYLLYTTKLNELYCVRLTEECVETLLKGDLSGNYRRSVEQGATIITAVPNSPRIVLQIPRGNLETISCRLISIDILNDLLNKDEWGDALRFIRLEKLNANLLFDLDPDRFLSQVARFVSNVKTVNELNSLCLEFEEGNVLKTLYKNWGKCENYPGKISKIFEEIFKYFDQVDYAPYITTIMIINLHFFKLKDALVYVQDLLRRSYDHCNLKKSVSEAVNTLKTYGCDQEKLYTEALFLYDLDLAHFVASSCQMDPRIYEPHLNNLKNLEEVQRRYEIHLHGKQPKMAIAYLLRCPKMASSDILDFIKNNQVSREAYESCKKESRHYQIVSKVFAEDLSKKGNNEEAGVILKRANLLEEALVEFKLALKWREVLDLGQELQLGEVERVRTINEMAGRLVQRRDIKDAAILYEFYSNNYEMAVKILIDNYFFEEALHLAKKHRRRDIVVSDIIPALKNYKSILEWKLRALGSIFDRNSTRLGEVRRLKCAKFNNFNYEGNDRDNDLFSDAGSVTSKSSRSSRSRSSTASSRNRRKEERKKQDLREGGIYEDIALIRAIHGLIKEIYSKGDEVKRSCLLFLQESDVTLQEIRTLYESYLTLLNKIKENLTAIWPPHFHVNNQTQDVQELADLANLEHLDMEFRTPPSGCPINWNLNIFT